MASVTLAVLDDFYAGLDKRISTFKEKSLRHNLAAAPPFSIFDFFQPGENTLSRIMADLLSPEGNHGQGPAFLNHFLEVIRHPELVRRASDAEIHFEWPYSIKNDAGRFDILIDLHNFVIVLENKLEAGEQPDQMERYRAYLQARYAGDFCLLFLTPLGTAPKTINDTDRVLLLSYKEDIALWLERCRRSAKSEKVRYFLDEFMRYLPAIVSTEEEGLMRPEVIEVILQHAFNPEHPEHLAAALLVGAAHQDISRQLVERTLQQVRQELESRGWDADIESGSDGYVFVSLRMPSWPHKFCVGFGRDNEPGYVYFYVSSWEGAGGPPRVDERIQDELNQKLPPRWKRDSANIWRAADKFSNWREIDTLLTVAKSSKPVEYIVATLENMRTIVEQIVEHEKPEHAIGTTGSQ